MILSLSEVDVASLLDMDDGIRVVEESFRQDAEGEAVSVPRISQTVPNGGGAFRIMPAIMPATGYFGLKTLTGFPGRRLPGETYFTLLLFEAKTGALRALIAGTHLTGIRTGASTGVATKYLARPDADVLGIFGAGAQARHQVAAVLAVRPVRLLKVLCRDFSRANEFAKSIRHEFDIEAQAVKNPREVVQGSSIVVTATTATEPLFSGEWLDPGTHVSGVGANTPKKIELDNLTFQRARIVVDSKKQNLEESGDLLQAISAGAVGSDSLTELGQIISGKPGARLNNDEITLFKSVGIAVQDIATGVFVYEQALKRGVGTPLDLTAEVAMVSR